MSITEDEPQNINKELQPITAGCTGITLDGCDWTDTIKVPLSLVGRTFQIYQPKIDDQYNRWFAHNSQMHNGRAKFIPNTKLMI